MEVRGGNAYIEDWPNARLLRDVHVQALWEGTGNISALDVGRAIAREGAGEALLAISTRDLRPLTIQWSLALRHWRGANWGDIGGILGQMAQAQPAERELRVKRLTQQLAHAVARRCSWRMPPCRRARMVAIGALLRPRVICAVCLPAARWHGRRD